MKCDDPVSPSSTSPANVLRAQLLRSTRRVFVADNDINGETIAGVLSSVPGKADRRLPRRAAKVFRRLGRARRAS